MVDDTERRLNALFDTMNCDALAPEILAQLGELTEGNFFVSMLARPND